MTVPSAASLRAAIERAYDAMEEPEAKGKKGKPRRETLSHELSRLQDCKRFIALCQREWAEEDRWKRDAVEAGARGDTVKTGPASLVKDMGSGVPEVYRGRQRH